MNKIFLAVLVLMMLPSVVSSQQNPKKLLIVEFSTGNEQSASAEFVELYNPNNDVVDLDDYEVQYQSATGTSWNSKAKLEGKIGPRGRYLVASSQLDGTKSQAMSSGLSASGGHVRITHQGNELDRTGWGSASSPEGEAIEAHSKEQSTKRLVDEDGYFIDSDDNKSDLFVSDTPTPDFDVVAQENSAQTPTTLTPKPSQSTHTSQQEQQTKTFDTVQLSELFIDPKSPLTDKEDEFVEIFNPNSHPVDLNDYQLQSGKGWRYKYTIESTIIAPNSYTSFYSADTGLTLSNSGSQVRILDPAGNLIDGVSYEKAKAGQSLVKLDGSWQWSDSPTPNEPNTTGSLESNGQSNSDDEQNLEHVFSASSGSDSESGTEQFSSDEQESSDTIDTSVLVIIGSLALLYGLYEYRRDIANIVTKTRRYFERRRKNRPKSKRQRSHRVDWRRWFRQNSLRARPSQGRRQ